MKFKKTWITYLLIFYTLTLLPIPIATASDDYHQILPGYSREYSAEGCYYVNVSWDVTSGPLISVFLFDEAQYNAWPSSPTFPLPQSAKIIWTDSDNGTFDSNLQEEEKYYVVFYNPSGSQSIYINIDVGFSREFPVWIFIGIIALTAAIGLSVILIYRGIKKSQAQSTPPKLADLKSTGAIFCIRCGSKNLATAKFCNSCGATIE